MPLSLCAVCQVDELGRIEQLHKNAGSPGPDSRFYEEAVSQLAALKRRLEDVEADKTGERMGGWVNGGWVAWLRVACFAPGALEYLPTPGDP